MKNIFTGKNKTRNIIILIGLALVVAGGAYSMFGEKALAPSKSDEKTETASSTSSALIQVSTQNPGSEVIIDSVTFEAPGWVTIYNDVDGEPSSILGAYWFDKGTHTGTKVNLFLDMVAGQTYYATLRSDDGKTIPDTAGSWDFNTTTDLPLKDSLTGEWIQTTFQITSTGSRG